jgi:hypothetical protein
MARIYTPILTCHKHFCSLFNVNDNIRVWTTLQQLLGTCFLRFIRKERLIFVKKLCPEINDISPLGYEDDAKNWLVSHL